MGGGDLFLVQVLFANNSVIRETTCGLESVPRVTRCNQTVRRQNPSGPCGSDGINLRYWRASSEAARSSDSRTSCETSLVHGHVLGTALRCASGRPWRTREEGHRTVQYSAARSYCDSSIRRSLSRRKRCAVRRSFSSGSGVSYRSRLKAARLKATLACPAKL